MRGKGKGGVTRPTADAAMTAPVDQRPTASSSEGGRVQGPGTGPCGHAGHTRWARPMVCTVALTGDGEDAALRPSTALPSNAPFPPREWTVRGVPLNISTSYRPRRPSGPPVLERRDVPVPQAVRQPRSDGGRGTRGGDGPQGPHAVRRGVRAREGVGGGQAPGPGWR